MLLYLYILTLMASNLWMINLCGDFAGISYALLCKSEQRAPHYLFIPIMVPAGI